MRVGRRNDYIREAIAAGLKLRGHSIILPSGKVAECTLVKSGYRRVSLGPEGKRRAFNAARVICWLAHGPPPTEDAQVDHVNRDRSDDRPINLRWVTASENAKNVSAESMANYRAVMSRNRRTLYGEDASNVKLSTKHIREIRALSEQGISQRRIATLFGINQATVSKIVRRTRWNHVK